MTPRRGRGQRLILSGESLRGQVSISLSRALGFAEVEARATNAQSCPRERVKRERRVGLLESGRQFRAIRRKGRGTKTWVVVLDFKTYAYISCGPNDVRRF